MNIQPGLFTEQGMCACLVHILCMSEDLIMLTSSTLVGGGRMGVGG